MRILVCGGPRSGKTTFAATLGVRVRHTDDLIGKLDWSGVSDHVATHWMTDPAPWCIEGVAVARALRKWIDNHVVKPADIIYHLPDPKVELEPRQEAMRKGCLKVFNEIRPALVARGCTIITP